MRIKTLLGVMFGCLLSATAMSAEMVVDIRDLGAVSDGKTLCTQSIQKAIDQCTATGGGTVYFPPGNWLSGTIYLKNHVTLYLESGSTLLGSLDPNDYPKNVPHIESFSNNYVCQSLIAGEDLEDVAIRGRGTINGQGTKYPPYPPSVKWPGFLTRPYVIRLVQCRGVLVEGITMRDSVMWMQHYLTCEQVRIHGVTVHNFGCLCNDGLDIDACRDVVVSDCKIDSSDDALCLKSTCSRLCENVTITNCLLSSHCMALKMGTESSGGFKNITITNCAISPPPRTTPDIYKDAGAGAGIALDLVDGGQLDRVTISNITMDKVNYPIHLRLGNRARPYSKDAPKPGIGSFRNVVLSNIIATNASKGGCMISGIPNGHIENVTLSNVRMEFSGGGTKEDAARKIEEKENAECPEAGTFGVLPAYGLFCRHVKGLRLDNVQLVVQTPDARPALVFDDASDVTVDGRKQ